MVGKAWLSLTSKLQEELRHTDPAACVGPWIDECGLLRFHVSIARQHHVIATAAVRRYLLRATSTCETCGGQVATVLSGSVVTVRCEGCMRSGSSRRNT